MLNRISFSWTGLLLIVLAMLSTVFALSHGVVSIDIARDLYQAQLIRDQLSFPLAGPPINGLNVLGPVWYYALAAATWLGGSLSAAFALTGLVLSLKYVFAYCVGVIWRGDAFAVLLVCAMAFPGVASYALLGVGHPSFVETFIWAAALFSLLAVRDGKRRRWFVLAGLASALALHAHPTAIVLVAPLAAALFLALWQRGQQVGLLRGAFLFLIALALPFVPLLFKFDSNHTSVVSKSVVETVQTGVSLLVIAKNLLWYQPILFARTYGIVDLAGDAAWRVIWCVVLLSVVAGATIGLSQRRNRKTLLLSIIALSVTILIVSLLRRVTPFYMLYVALPLLGLAIALSWEHLYATRYRALAVIACITTLSAQLLIVYGIVESSKSGLLDSRLPFGSDLQLVPRERKLQPVTSAPTRDAFARWLCAQPGTTVIHGSFSAALDIGLGVELPLSCSDVDVRIGRKLKIADPVPPGTHWIGLPQDVWRDLAIGTEVNLNGVALNRVSAVQYPKQAMSAANGETYPPRLDDMLAALEAKSWQSEFTSSSTEVVSVAALIPLLSNWRVDATANGELVKPTHAFGSNVLFRCEPCTKNASVAWRVQVSGATPETTSIVTFSATLP
jgi:hypothetical protein